MISVGDKIQKIFEERMIPFVKKTGSLITDCVNPNCENPEAKLWIRSHDGASICFRCKFKATPAGLISKVLKISFAEAHSLVFGTEAGERIAYEKNALAHIKFEDFIKIEEEKEETKTNAPVKLWYLFPVSKNENAVAQLKKRGVSPEFAEEMGLKSHPSMDAVFFESRDPSNSFSVGYQYRLSNPAPGQPKTITMRGFQKNLHLLFIEKVSEADAICIVEGPYDALKCWSGGLPTVAAYGKLVSREQIEMIENLPCSIVFVGLDRDAAKEARELIDTLSRTKIVYRILPPAGRDDLGDCTSEDILAAVRTAEKCSGEKTQRLEVFLKPEVASKNALEMLNK